MTNPDKELRPGSQVRFQVGADEIRGTVVEDRGPIGKDGRTLFRLQLVPDGSEIELPANALVSRSPSPNVFRKLEELLERLSPDRSALAAAALEMFQGPMRSASFGLWPEHLVDEVARRGHERPSRALAEEVLDDLALTGLVVKRPSGLYISTNWLLAYLNAPALVHARAGSGKIKTAELRWGTRGLTKAAASKKTLTKPTAKKKKSNKLAKG